MKITLNSLEFTASASWQWSAGQHAKIKVPSAVQCVIDQILLLKASKRNFWEIVTVSIQYIQRNSLSMKNASVNEWL